MEKEKESVGLPGPQDFLRDVTALFVGYGSSEKAAKMIASYLLDTLKPLRKELVRMVMDRKVGE